MRVGSWLQLNVGLTRAGGGALPSARRLFGALAGAVEIPFFFSRKPPDVRLRFATDDPKRTFRALWPVLRELQREGAVDRFFRSVYEPEERLFGGAPSSAAVHRWFCADTAAWIALDQRVARGEATVPQGAIPRAVLESLIAHAIRDRTEIWDTWAGLEALAIELGADDGGAAPERHGLDALRAMAGPEDAHILAAWADGSAALATELAEVWAGGRMRAGLRAVLTYVALFTANRHGLDGRATRALARAEAALRDPHASLIPSRVPK